MFESRTELAELQELLDTSFERAGERIKLIYGPNKPLSAKQLAGFRGTRLVAVASVNSEGEPRVAPRSAAFLHGKFYLAANSKSITVRRLRRNPKVSISYFENRFLLIGHGRASILTKEGGEFERLTPEREEAFDCGTFTQDGLDVLVRMDLDHLVAFAHKPERYPAAWEGRR
jgi:hypothetical protein